MGVSVDYVRPLKTGRLEYRRPFPVLLRQYLGKRELIRSLKATSIAEAGVMERWRAANDEYDAHVALGRKKAAGDLDELDAPKAAWLVESHFAVLLAKDDARRIAGTADPEMHEAADDGLRETLARGNIEHIAGMFADDVNALAARQGWHFDNQGEPFARLCFELLRAEIRANEVAMARDEGAPVETPQATVAPSTQRGHPKARGLSFDAIVRVEMNRPTFDAGASTKQSWNTALRYFRELHGEPSPEEITRRAVSDLADVLTLAPLKSAVPKSQRAWELRKLAQFYADKDVKRISHKTRRAIVGALHAAWNKCQRSGTIPDGLVNPFNRPNVGKAPVPKNNDGLTREETRAIFALSVFTGGERPVGGRGEASFWLPLLLFTTGARPEEVAQLLVADVCKQDDGWSIAITADGGHQHKPQRRLKSHDAQRVVPLPSILIDLGFADYVAWLRANGELALFPMLRTKGERRELFASFGAWWGRYLRSNGAIGSGKRPAREFRPTWATIARECGIRREAQEYLMGHAPIARDMNARYGNRAPLSRGMHELAFEGWGLENVRRWQVPLIAAPLVA